MLHHVTCLSFNILDDPLFPIVIYLCPCIAKKFLYLLGLPSLLPSYQTYLPTFFSYQVLFVSMKSKFPVKANNIRISTNFIKKILKRQWKHKKKLENLVAKKLLNFVQVTNIFCRLFFTDKVVHVFYEK